MKTNRKENPQKTQIFVHWKIVSILKNLVLQHVGYPRTFSARGGGWVTFLPCFLRSWEAHGSKVKYPKFNTCSSVPAWHAPVPIFLETQRRKAGQWALVPDIPFTLLQDAFHVAFPGSSRLARSNNLIIVLGRDSALLSYAQVNRHL